MKEDNTTNTQRGRGRESEKTPREVEGGADDESERCLA